MPNAVMWTDDEIKEIASEIKEEQNMATKSEGSDQAANVENENTTEDFSESVVKQVNAQPYEVYSSVSADVDSKGNIKPACKITIKRGLESGDKIIETIEGDVKTSLDKVVSTVNEIMELYNEGRD